jgi:hypothetical protein
MRPLSCLLLVALLCIGVMGARGDAEAVSYRASEATLLPVTQAQALAPTEPVSALAPVDDNAIPPWMESSLEHKHKQQQADAASTTLATAAANASDAKGNAADQQNLGQ